MPYGESTKALFGDIDWKHPHDQYPVTNSDGFIVPQILRHGTSSPVEVVTPEFLEQSKSNPAKADEFVLAVPAGNIIERLAKEARPELVKEVLFSDYYVRRSWCENNPDWVQLLPYIVFFKRVEGRLKVFVYQRGKGVGEERLAGNCSIGVGGHINPHDQFEYVQDENLADYPGPHARNYGVKHAILRNIKREVGEEVKITRGGVEISLSDLPGYDDENFEKSITRRLTAFLDYASSAVEKVHLGLFIGIEVPEDVEICTAEAELIDVGFMDLERLHYMRELVYHEKLDWDQPLENWSMAIVESIVDTANYEPGAPANWLIGTLSRIFGTAPSGEKDRPYGPNLFMRV